MSCRKCQKSLTGKQKSFCSIRCSKLYLKSEYRKRNRDKINAYNRKYRKTGIRYSPEVPKEYLVCLKCKTMENVQKCHIRPRNKKGKTKYNIAIFCQKHHSEFDNLLRSFWD